MKILAGDIGGTHTRLAVYRIDSGEDPQLLELKSYASASSSTLSGLLSRFLDEDPGLHFDRVCLGIAGPIVDQTCNATNLPWRISAVELSERFGFPWIRLLNDLEANAWAIEALQEQDILQLNSGAPSARGNRSIISAGTGLGEAGLYWDGTTYHPFSSEGSHADFSPSNPLELELHQWLAERHGHVSWERLVSGPGLANIYRFLNLRRKESPPDWLQQEIDRQGMAPAVSAAALNDRDPVCVQSLDLFIELFGREAGNHALKIMSTGGVYLGGGIAPRILPAMKQGGFLDAFLDKGRMRPLMESMPVRIILNDQAALLGAASYAIEH